MCDRCPRDAIVQLLRPVGQPRWIGCSLQQVLIEPTHETTVCTSSTVGEVLVTGCQPHKHVLVLHTFVQLPDKVGTTTGVSRTMQHLLVVGGHQVGVVLGACQKGVCYLGKRGTLIECLHPRLYIG